MKDAVKEIKDNLDVVKILKYYNIDVEDELVGEFRMECPLHEATDKNETAFIINANTGLWVCHTTCGVGSIFHFIQEIEGISFHQAVDRLCEILSIDGAELKEIPRHITEARKFIRKKKKVENKEWKNEFNVKAIKNFRNYSSDTLKHFKAGYIEKELGISKKGKEFDLKKKLAIPLYENNKLIGVSMRRLDPNDKLKWLHYPPGLYTGNILYNIDACKEFDEIIVVEGIFDVWSMKEAGLPNTVCTFGCHLSDEQYRMLMRSGKNVVMAYDGDIPGQEGTEDAVKRLKNKVKLSKMVFEKGKDPGDYTPEELYQIYERRVRL